LVVELFESQDTLTGRVFGMWELVSAGMVCSNVAATKQCLNSFAELICIRYVRDEHRVFLWCFVLE